MNQEQGSSKLTRIPIFEEGWYGLVVIPRSNPSQL